MTHTNLPNQLKINIPYIHYSASDLENLNSVTLSFITGIYLVACQVPVTMCVVMFPNLKHKCRQHRIILITATSLDAIIHFQALLFYFLFSFCEMRDFQLRHFRLWNRGFKMLHGKQRIINITVATAFWSIPLFFWSMMNHFLQWMDVSSDLIGFIITTIFQL